MATSEREGTVLVVDDEREVADAYALRLEQEYDVRTAYGGEQALEEIDRTIDVVLLDRRMPRMAGDEVLDVLRDRGYDCGVVMVTGVDADLDIIDMPFDDYLTKPVDREPLFEAVEGQLDARERDEAVSELFSVTAKIGVLEDELPSSELDDNPEYEQLKTRADELRERIHEDGDGEPETNGAGDGSGDGFVGRITSLFGR